MKHLAIWRPIVMQIAVMLGKRSGKGVQEVIANTVNGKRPEVKEVLMDIFGQPTSNLPIVKDPIWFVKREKYPEDISQAVSEALLDFLITSLSPSL